MNEIAYAAIHTGAMTCTASEPTCSRRASVAVATSASSAQSADSHRQQHEPAIGCEHVERDAREAKPARDAPLPAAGGAGACVGLGVAGRGLAGCSIAGPVSAAAWRV